MQLRADFVPMPATSSVIDMAFTLLVMMTIAPATDSWADPKAAHDTLDSAENFR